MYDEDEDDFGSLFEFLSPRMLGASSVLQLGPWGGFSRAAPRHTWPRT
jgi:hypothetical protein